MCPMSHGKSLKPFKKSNATEACGGEPRSILPVVADGVDLVRRLLIDIVVEPVRKKQMRDAAPAHDRLLRRIVVRIVVHRNLRMQARFFIAVVLLLERIRIVLRVARDEELAFLEIRDGVDARRLLRINIAAMYKFSFQYIHLFSIVYPPEIISTDCKY